MIQHYLRRALAGLGLLATLAVPGLAQEKEPAQAPPAAGQAPAKAVRKDVTFLRVQRDKHGDATALETAIVRYVPVDAAKEGIVVDLVGAVHVADAAYYKTLNKRFKEYDALLFELVAEEGTRIPKGGKREGVPHPVAGLQMGMTSVLDLSFQLEAVNYQRKNFVHADMSPEEFAKSMDKKGESFLNLYLRMMGQGMAMQAKDGGKSDLKILGAFFSSNRSLALKRALADQFENMGGQLRAIEGKEGSTLVVERNKKALSVLTREMQAGKKKFGIFYGAAHLPDMEQRLLAEFGLKREREEWLTAWDLADK